MARQRAVDGRVRVKADVGVPLVLIRRLFDGIDDVLDAHRRAPRCSAEGVDVGLPEAKGQREMLIVIARLTGEEHHEVLVEKVEDLTKRGIGEGRPQVYAGHLDSNATCERADVQCGHRGLGHGISP